MINISDRQDCCGCSACYSICPKSCIEMKADREGFSYPCVDETRCINCHLCEKVCPVIMPLTSNYIPKVKIARTNDKDILKDSTSGGLFTTFAETFFADGGDIVYGATYDDEFNIVHAEVKNVQELYKFRGSKFVQSSIINVFGKIKNELKSGKKILFSGTPCQIQGLKKYLGNNLSNLLTIDFVCRGVTSPKLWHSYVEYQSKKFKSCIKSVKFRNKTYGYHSPTMKIQFQNGKIYSKSGRTDYMLHAFVHELASRPSCGNCRFKTESRVSDITLFDCKKFSRLTGVQDDDKGYSCLFIQSRRGEQLYEMAKKSITSYDADKYSMINLCGIMALKSAIPNKYRDEFYESLCTDGIKTAINKYAPISFKDQMIERSKKFLYKFNLINMARSIKKKEIINTK